MSYCILVITLIESLGQFINNWDPQQRSWDISRQIPYCCGPPHGFPLIILLCSCLPAESKSTCEWCCELCTLQQLLLLFPLRICQCCHMSRKAASVISLCSASFLVCYHALKCSSSRFTNFIGQLVSVQGMMLQYIVPYMPTHQFLQHTE
jgi:hypothetical protein